MRLIATLLCLGAALSPGLAQKHYEAIDFAPLPRPKAGELAGCSIGIVTLPPKETDKTRRSADLALVTAGHLFHFIEQAGGKVALARRDPYQEHASADNEMDLGRLQRLGCRIVLVITYAEKATRPKVYAAKPEDERLAENLAGPVGSETVNSGPPDELASAATSIETMQPRPMIAVMELPDPNAAAKGSVRVADRRACLERAWQIYCGLRNYWKLAGKPEVIKASAGAGDSRLFRPWDLARRIWPEGPLPAERIGWFCERFVETSITNPTLVYLAAEPKTSDNQTVLSISTNVPQVADGLSAALRAAYHSDVQFVVTTLPCSDRLGNARFGVCQVTAALTYRKPGGRGGRQTQLLWGEPVFLLDQRGGYYLVHAGDGYWGWVRQSAVRVINAERFDAYLNAPTAIVGRDLTTSVGLIPAGARVRLAGGEETGSELLLPDGTALPVPAGLLITGGKESEADGRIEAALDQLYVPYLFGGRSPLGMDCSGLVTNVTARFGRPARDAAQQALAGRLVATPWHRSAIRAGDRLYFIDERGKIYHTGLALGPRRFIHCSPPCVQVNSFDPQDPLYSHYLDKTFFCAKRR